MSDISSNKSVIVMTSDLQKKHTEILINEKKAEMEAIDLRIKNLESIDLKRLKYNKDVADEELKDLEGKLKQLKNP